MIARRVILTMAAVLAACSEQDATCPPSDTRDAVVESTLSMPMDRWNWSSGVALYGLMLSDACTDDPRTAEMTRTFVDTHAPGLAPGHVNEAVPGLATLLLYERDGDPDDLRTVRDLAAYYADTHPRWQNGALIHAADETWVDTMFMVAPLWARLGEVTGDTAHFDQATRQLLAHAELLQDDDGLFIHGWDPPGGLSSPRVHWGRGNAWAAMATAEVLRRLPAQHPDRAALEDIVARQLRAAMALQDASGRWHTVLDDPDTYLENSATAGLARALELAADQGLLGNEATEAASRARDALAAHVDPQGALGEVSGSTAFKAVDYDGIDAAEPTLWGQGIYLMLLRGPD